MQYNRAIINDTNIDYNSSDTKNLYRSISLILHNGWDVNMKSILQESPLLLAVQYNFFELAQKLIANGADVNALSRCRKTLLHSAIEADNLEAVFMLLVCGADVNFESGHGDTPFGTALRHDKFDIASILLDYYDKDDAILEAASHETTTALTFMSKLVESGADVNPRDDGRKNPILRSIQLEDSKLFEQMWPKCNHRRLLDFKPNFLITYLRYCSFPEDDFVYCLHLIFESFHLIGLVKNASQEELCRQSHAKVFAELLDAFERKRLSRDQRVGLIYASQVFGAPVKTDSILCIYWCYGFHAELEAVIYCSAHTDRLHMYCFPESLLLRTIFAVRRDTFVSFFWTRCDSDFAAAVSHKCWTRTELVRVLDFYALPDIGRRDIFQQYVDDLEFLKKLVVSPKFPSLIELSRAATRKLVQASNRIKQPYQFYDAVKRLDIPQTLQDIICFKQPIYIINAAE